MTATRMCFFVLCAALVSTAMPAWRKVQVRDGKDKSTRLGPLVKTLPFAARKHRDERRKDAQASPYINHPIAYSTAAPDGRAVLRAGR
jgi:hypothetical protein